eukprot:TRINITY_DN16480_c0_g1_i1.p1 TRINITY_DN16480_c0_g1~~TRINITY_DN16480_c0_g1_i1.p1  ORF type:complete len:176 (+),score=25.57 TRINITY_DN16480_c0_g1_i1:147-674(+)
MSACTTFAFPMLAVIESDFAKTGSSLILHVRPDKVVTAARDMAAKGYFIEDVCGLDMAEGFEVVYHFTHAEQSGRITIRAVIPRDNPRISTISHIFQGANWHERETHDFFGIEFVDHPNLTPLLLAEDADCHPLVKEDKKRKPAVELYVDHMLGSPLATESDENAGDTQATSEGA